MCLSIHSASLWLPKEDNSDVGGAGHLNASGNVWVAERVYQRILQMPALRQSIAAARSSDAEAEE